MFTGIIEETGIIKSIKSSGNNTDIIIKAKKVLEGTHLGDSIQVNGVCLTVTDIKDNCFSAFAMAETMRRTAFKTLKAGSKVNLERALRADTRLGGHIVSGHVDGVGKITELKKEGDAIWIYISASDDILKYIVLKGSIAIDGISLTVAKVSGNTFAVSVIPHTQEATTLLEKKKGDFVNLENDIIGKYVERLITFKRDEDKKDEEGEKKGNEKPSDSTGLTLEKLSKYGYL